MAGARKLTESGLRQLRRELSSSVTPPPPEPQNTPMEVEMRNVSNLMFSLGRYKKGRECIKQHGITKTSLLSGILCHGAEPSLEELQVLKSILQTNYDQLRPKEQPESRLRRLKQEVLNILLRLFQLGNQGHWVLAEEQDIQIRDYTYDPILEYEGSYDANPDWWERKLARLVEKFEQAENNLLLFTTAPADAIDALHEQLTQQGRLIQQRCAISVGDWVQQIAPPSKRSFDMVESEEPDSLQSGNLAKRRKLPESQERVKRLPRPVSIVPPHTLSGAHTVLMAEAPRRRSVMREKPDVKSRVGASARGQTTRKGNLGSAGTSSSTQEAGGVQTSRFGRVLRRPDRYGFPDPKVASRSR